MKRFRKDQWAVILGGSSGFGLATAHKLSTEGMSICLVHRDRRGSMDRIEQEFAQIKANGGDFIPCNLDALSPAGVDSVLVTLRAATGECRVRVLLHSIAFGNLKPIAPPIARDLATDSPSLMDEEDMARTVHSMGTSLLTWVQRLFQARLFAADARVFGLTSEGNEVAWRGYAAVAAAKCALESVSRSIALEYGAYGIRCNVIQAGITDTPALRLIPGAEQMKNSALRRNPLQRLTTPKDVADVISLLSSDEAQWINGALIRVDGGEHIGSV